MVLPWYGRSPVLGDPGRRSWEAIWEAIVPGHRGMVQGNTFCYRNSPCHVHSDHSILLLPQEARPQHLGLTSTYCHHTHLRRISSYVIISMPHTISPYHPLTTISDGMVNDHTITIPHHTITESWYCQTHHTILMVRPYHGNIICTR